MLRNLLAGLTNLVYPRVCVICKDKLKDHAKADDFVCLECWNKIKKNNPPFCHSCGRHLEKRYFSTNICPDCIKTPLNFDRAFSPCIFEGTLKELIHHFKYRGKDYLGTALSRLMIDFIDEYDLPLEILDYIIPIPLHKARLREREFNQANILGKKIADRYNKQILEDVLLRQTNTKTQTDLELDQRRANVENCFKVEKADLIKNKNILLVDDVLTSGATTSEAALTLKRNGANIVFVLTLTN